MNVCVASPGEPSTAVALVHTGLPAGQCAPAGVMVALNASCSPTGTYTVPVTSTNVVSLLSFHWILSMSTPRMLTSRVNVIGPALSVVPGSSPCGGMV